MAQDKKLFIKDTVSKINIFLIPDWKLKEYTT